MAFDKIRSWGGDTPESCVLCTEGEESPIHLFFECRYGGKLWKGVQEKLGSPLGHDSSRIARIAEVVERIDRMARNSPN